MLRASETLSVILGDQRRYLWGFDVQLELFQLLADLWPRLDLQERSALSTAILAGPPRDLFRADLGDDPFEHIRDRAVWERLTRIASVKPGLEGEALARLAELESSNEEFRLTGEPSEGFSSWMESGWGSPSDYSAKELLDRDNESIARLLIEHEQNREGLLDTWRQAAASEPDRALAVMHELLARSYLDRAVWARSLGAVRDLLDRRDLRSQLFAIIEQLPRTALKRFASELSDLLRSVAKELKTDEDDAFWGSWDRLLDVGERIPPQTDEISMTQALGHPVGILAEAVLLRLGGADRGSGLQQALESRLRRILGLPAAVGNLGLLMIGARLAILHDVDPDWTALNLTPRFDWERSEVEAASAWDGFLWSPWIRPSLWADLKPYFLQSFEHLEEIGDDSTRLAAVLASIAIEGEDAITPEECRRPLRSLGHEGRESIAIWIDRKTKNAGDRASALWRDSVIPWLRDAWPKEPGLRNQAVSKRLPWAAARSGDAFEEAVAVMLPIVGPISNGRLVIKQLREEGVAQQYPQACLALINALTPDAPDFGFGPLGEFLEALRQAQDELQHRAEFRRLKEIALQHQL